MKLNPEIVNKVLKISVLGALGASSLDGSYLRGCDSEEGFNRDAGHHNHDLSMGGTKLDCTNASFTTDGTVIKIKIAHSPADIQGASTRYRIESSEPTVEGEFVGTEGEISAEGVGRHPSAYAKMEFPFGDNSTYTDDCNGQGLPLVQAAKP